MLSLEAHIDLPVAVVVGTAKPFVHEAHEAVEALEHALDLKDFNGFAQIRIKHLKEIVTFGASSTCIRRRSVCDRTRSMRPIRCSIDDGIQLMP